MGPVELVRLLQIGCRQIALEIGVNANMLTSWMREADIVTNKAFAREGLPEIRSLHGSSLNWRASPMNEIFTRRGTVLCQGIIEWYTMIQCSRS